VNDSAGALPEAAVTDDVSTPINFMHVAAVLDNLPMLIANARAARGWSYEELSKRIDVNVQVIWKVEHNYLGITVKTANKLLRWLATEYANGGNRD
jgi:ribosome-binding protein aMBF1 (putative translation factor)